MRAQVRWCQRRISSRFPNFHFQVADIYNPAYNPRGRYKAREYVFPYGDNAFDFVFATSVFTHMLPQDMERYLTEIVRVLKPGGRCLVTFFLLSPQSLELIAKKQSTLDFAYGLEGYRTISREVPESAVAYDEEYVRSLVAQLGAEINAPVHYGFWCGRDKFLSKQDIIVAHKL